MNRLLIAAYCLLITLPLAACLQPISAMPTTAAATPTNLVQAAPAAQEQDQASGALKLETSFCATVIANRALHLRAEPSEKSQVLDYLYHGEQIKVIDLSSPWWKVQTLSGKTGYARASYLEQISCHEE